MAFDELVSQLTLDSSGYTSGASDAERASEDLADSTGAVQEGLFDLDSAGVAAGAGIAAVGGAITAVVEDTKEWRESLGRTRTTMGLTQEEANGLARSISNATFPMDDAVSTMDSLARQGVETEEEMQNVATAADMIADATGTSATAIADNAVPALRAMGGEASDLEENMDAFTFVARNSTMSVEDFSRVVQKTGPEIQEMGLSVDDTATILTALEEKGLDSRTAMREFRQAARDADGDQQKLIETLNLSEQELSAQQQALAESEGATRSHAEAANESVTTMDRLRHGFDEAKLAAGGLLNPLEAAGPVLMGLGGAMSVVSAINFGAVIPSLLGVMATISPLLPLIIGLSAVAAGLYAAWDSNFLGIQNITQDVFGAIGDLVDWLGGLIQDGVQWYIDMWMLVPEGIAKVIDMIPGINSEDVLGDIDTDSIMDSLFPPKPGEEAEEVGEEIGESTAVGVSSALPGDDEGIIDPGATAAVGGSSTSAASSGGESSSEVSTRTPTRTSRSSQQSTADAIREALEGLLVRVETGDETLDRVIDERAEIVIEREWRSAKRLDGRPM